MRVHELREEEQIHTELGSKRYIRAHKVEEVTPDNPTEPALIGTQCWSQSAWSTEVLIRASKG